MNLKRQLIGWSVLGGLATLGVAQSTSTTQTITTTLTTASTVETTRSRSASASYSVVTSLSTTASALPTYTAVPSFTVSDTTSALAPTGSAYSLNSSFEINSDAVTRTYDWTIAAQTGAPDGYSRKYITINGQSPGPLIEANEGDTLEITVRNELEIDTTAIHWHGMYQNGTAWMDGVPGVSQCPIQPGSSFTYTFTVQQYGTYWYHSHTSVQYTDGLSGPLIIHSTDDPLVRGTDFDYEQVLFVNDWWHDEGNAIADALLSVGGYYNSTAAPSPQSGLVNGQGIFNCSALDSSDTTDCTTPTTYPEFNVAPNAKTRFRLINGGSHAQFYFSVDNHTVSVIEADGTPVSGSGNLTRIPFHNGQRYSAIVDTTVGSEGDAFWMRFQMNTNCFAWVDDALNPTVKAVMRYGNTSIGNPSTSDWDEDLPSSCEDLDDSLLTPLESQSIGDAQKVDRVDSSYGTITYGPDTFARFFMNSTTYLNYAYQPLLEEVNANGTDAINTDAVAFLTYEDDVWVADIIINNGDPTLDHPYHMHGNEFHVVARGSGTLSVADAASLTYNTTNPVRRDTLVIPGGSYAVLRFTNDNPGVWVVHCHIAWHLGMGFLGVVVSNPDAIGNMSIPSTMDDLCAARPDDVPIDIVEPGRRRGLSPVSLPLSHRSAWSHRQRHGGGLML